MYIIKYYKRYISNIKFFMDIAEIDWNSFPLTFREYYNNSYKVRSYYIYYLVHQFE